MGEKFGCLKDGLIGLVMLIIAGAIIGGTAVGVECAFDESMVCGILVSAGIAAVIIYLLVSIDRAFADNKGIWLWPLAYLLYGVKGIVLPLSLVLKFCYDLEDEEPEDKTPAERIQLFINQHIFPASSEEGLISEILWWSGVVPVLKLAHFLIAAAMCFLGAVIGTVILFWAIPFIGIVAIVAWLIVFCLP